MMLAVPSDWTVDERGWCGAAVHHESPNGDERPPDTPATLLVVHCISLPAGSYGGTEVVDLFLNRLDCDRHASFADLRGLKVSSHFLIRRDGGLVQFVSCDRRAWHAGVSSFAGRSACNDFSIGVELEGIDSGPFESVQYQALARLARLLVTRYRLTDAAAHSEIAPGRKTDPGPFFEWSRFLALIDHQLRHHGS